MSIHTSWNMQNNRIEESTSFAKGTSFGISSHTARLDLNADEDNEDGTKSKFDLNGLSWAQFVTIKLVTKKRSILVFGVKYHKLRLARVT